ncbi:MAG: DUF3179 domain-containing protein [Chloroflexi bacterium]|nr:DUF3179 domain-containing protein [Chloroflexota bacterium]
MPPRARRRALIVVAALAVLSIVAVACGSAASGTGDGDTTIDDPSADPVATVDPVLLFGPEWQTDFSKHSVEFDELLRGQVRDGIPAIDNPQFTSIAGGNEFLAEQEPVIVLELNGDARAYPIQILIWHEIVNDVVGGVPVTVTFCPLCNSAIAFEREFNGRLFDFGTSGLLRNSDLVMYDRQTQTWWQQFTGEAIVGELTGTLLEVVPASIVSWGDFKETHPDGQTLSLDTGFARSYGSNPYVGYDTTESRPFLFDGDPDGRLLPAERIVAVELNGETVAYPFAVLEGLLVVEDTVGGEPIVVFFQPGTVSALDRSTIADSRDVGASGVFRPEAAGQTLTFRADGEVIVDNETGSEWNVLGKAMSGPLEGTELTPVIHGDHFWFAWAAFKPETRIFGG